MYYTDNQFFNQINTQNKLVSIFNQIEGCFIEWVSSIANLSLGQIIAIDGKTIRGAKT